jgi:hypothetical protein
MFLHRLRCLIVGWFLSGRRDLKGFLRQGRLILLSLVHRTAQIVDQRPHVDRLGHIAVKASGQHPFFVTVHRMGRQRHTGICCHWDQL